MLISTKTQNKPKSFSSKKEVLTEESQHHFFTILAHDKRRKLFEILIENNKGLKLKQLKRLSGENRALYHLEKLIKLGFVEKGSGVNKMRYFFKADKANWNDFKREAKKLCNTLKISLQKLGKTLSSTTRISILKKLSHNSTIALKAVVKSELSLSESYHKFDYHVKELSRIGLIKEEVHPHIKGLNSLYLEPEYAKKLEVLIELAQINPRGNY